MTDPRHNFDTHRCGAMPKGFSIRRYRSDERYPWPESGGWVLSRTAWDSEWDYTYLEHVNPWRRHGMRFCPWCGEKL